MCTSLQFHVRDPRNIFYYQHGIGNYTDQVLNFLLSHRHEYIHRIFQSVILVSILMGLFNFFFVLQYLIDRIHSYFQRIAFQRNLLLIGLQHSTSQVFPNVNKQPSWEWCWKDKSRRKVAGEHQISKSPFF